MNLIVDNIPKQKTPIRKMDIGVGEVTERHLESNLHAIKFGLSANKPDGVLYGATVTRAYFATDTNVLYIHNGSSWKSVTLS